MSKGFAATLTAATLAGLAAGLVAAPGPREEHDRRMAWWREARFGMFIHWGLYAVPAGEWKGQRDPGNGEWIRKQLRIPAGEYDPLVQQFNPTAFDAKAWARLAREAGMKYVVITSKHHDGFALWDSKVSDFDVMATPFSRDVLRELTDAVRSEGLKMCFYHSILDWHHPDAQGRFFPDYEKTPNPDWSRYVESYLKPQLREIVTGYGPLGVLWFDGEWALEWTQEQGHDLYAFVRGLQPDIIINNRVGKSRAGMSGFSKSPDDAGDFGTPEQEVPATGVPGVDWESCMTMNDTWGYKHFDHNWKSAETLIRTLVDTASKGGNLLLNVGPTGEGRIPAVSAERLRAMGRWLATNGEAVYGTEASPVPAPAWGRLTRKGGRLFLHVFDWPSDGTLTVPVAGTVTRALLLADPGGPPLAVRTSPQGLRLSLPKLAPDPVASVVALELEGEPTPVR